MGRKCAVPHCYTGYRKCKEKASLFKAPVDDFFLGKWQEAIAREDRPITPKDHVCEKHFTDEDFIRKRIIHNVLEPYERPKLKPDAIPSIFPDFPEFILKMTKKRRKIPVESNVTIVDIPKKSGDDLLTTNEKDTVNMLNDETTETTSLDNEVTVLNDDEITIKSETDEPMDTLVETAEDDPNGPKMHRCNECDYKTKYAHNLRTHKTKHLSGDDVYMSCEYCVTYKTKWESTYLNHMKTKHGINMHDTLKCTFCHFKTKVLICLTRHCDREHKGHETIIGDNNFKCEHVGCDYTANSNALMSVHSLVHKKNETNQTVKKAFSCTECDFETNSKRHIVIHTKSAHNSGDNSVVPMNSTKKSPLNVHTAKKCKTVPKFKCSRCPYRTHSQNSLEKHLVKHQFSQQSDSQETTTKTLKCPNCSYTSLFSHELDDHQRTTCKNKFYCKECPLTFNIKSDYIKHILTHRNTTIEAVKSNKTFSISKDERNNQSSSEVQEFDTVLIKEEHHYDDDYTNSL